MNKPVMVFSCYDTSTVYIRLYYNSIINYNITYYYILQYIIIHIIFIIFYNINTI